MLDFHDRRDQFHQPLILGHPIRVREHAAVPGQTVDFAQQSLLILQKIADLGGGQASLDRLQLRDICLVFAKRKVGLGCAGQQ